MSNDQDKAKKSGEIVDNDTSGYVGVSPEYRNYADETHKALLSDADREFMQERGLLTDDEREAELLAGEDEDDKSSEDEDDKSSESSDDNNRGGDDGKSPKSTPVKASGSKAGGKDGELKPKI